MKDNIDSVTYFTFPKLTKLKRFNRTASGLVIASAIFDAIFITVLMWVATYGLIVFALINTILGIYLWSYFKDNS